MDWFLYDKDLRHERIKMKTALENILILAFKEPLI